MSIRNCRGIHASMIVCVLCTVVWYALGGPAGAATAQEEQIAQADQLIIDKRYDEALAILDPLVSSPEPIAQLAKGALERCYRSAKQWDEAIAVLESCVHDYPADAVLWQTRLGRLYKEMGDNAKAIAAFKNGIDSDARTPGATQVLTEFLWQLYAEKGDWDAAESYYQALLVKYPKDAAEWRYQLSRCYGATGEIASAIAELETAMQLVKEDPDGAKRIAPPLAGFYQTAGEFGKAEAFLRGLSQTYPTHSSYWASCEALMLLHRGSNLQSVGRTDDAIPLYRELIDRLASVPECRDSVESAYIYIVLCLAGSNRNDEAALYVKKLDEQQPDMRACALVTRGLVSYFTKKYDDAVTALSQMTSDYPNNAHAQLTRSLFIPALRGAGRVDEAVEALKSQVSGAPNPEQKAAALFHIADVYMEAQRFNDAIGVLEQSSEFAGSSHESQARAAYTLCYCYRKVGRNNAAEDGMRAVIDRYPGSEAARDARVTLDSWSVENDQ